MVKTKKRNGLLVILSVSMLLVSSIAFFTDNKTNGSRGALGDLSVSTDLTLLTPLDNVAPGDELGLNLNVVNDGSLDSDMRHTFRLSVPEEDLDLYSLDSLTLFVDGVKVVSNVNTNVVVDVPGLDSKVIRDSDLSIVASDSLLNGVQGRNFKLEVLTEVKQLNSPDWFELVVEEIVFGDELDFKVVPSTNLIKTDSGNIMRSPVPNYDAVGYVRFFTDLVNRYTSDSLKDEFLNGKSVLNIYSPSGVLYAGDDIVETGAIVKLEEEGTTYDSLVFVSVGDLDEDGHIIGNDRVELTTLFHISRGILQGDISTRDYLVADLDNDGRITRNDLLLMIDYLLGRVEELPMHYPVAPYGVRKPDLSISMGDKFDEDIFRGAEAWDLGNIIPSGSEVSAGDILKVSVNIDNLRGKTVFGTDIELLFDSDHFEVVEVEGYGGVIWDTELSGIEGGLAPAMRRYPSTSTYSSSVDYLLDGSGVLLEVDGTSGFREASHTGNSYLSGSGSHQIIALKVKDNIPSGTELKISFGNLSLLYEGYGGITYSDVWSSNASASVVIK